MNLSKLSLSQIVNLSLAVFLLLGIAATTYTVNNLRDTEAEAARGGKNATPASIKVDQTDVHFGDSVTFTTSGGKYIHVICYQTLASIVYGTTQPIGTSFLLTPSNVYGNPYNPEWGADCYAYLYSRVNSRSSDFLAFTAFSVAR